MVDEWSLQDEEVGGITLITVSTVARLDDRLRNIQDFDRNPEERGGRSGEEEEEDEEEVEEEEEEEDEDEDQEVTDEDDEEDSETEEIDEVVEDAMKMLGLDSKLERGPDELPLPPPPSSAEEDSPAKQTIDPASQGGRQIPSASLNGGGKFGDILAGAQKMKEEEIEKREAGGTDAMQQHVFPSHRRKENLSYFNLKVVFDPQRTGFEDRKEFHADVGTLIAGRYEVDEVLGTAAFSTALAAVDLSQYDEDKDELADDAWVCLKVIKEGKDFFDQALDEVKLLQHLNSHGNPDELCFLKLVDYFYYKEHLFIVSELLRDNLYDFGRTFTDANQPPYFTMPRLKKIAKQVLLALVYVHSLGMIHCDIKPENIVMKSYSRCLCKVIDFGSSCFQTDHLTTYIQSRSYRAPEVIIGHPYDGRIDVWSLGAVLAEMYAGYVLFSNDSVPRMLARIQGICGDYPEDMLRRGRDSHKYFTSSFQVYEEVENEDEDDEDDEDDENDENENDDDDDDEEEERETKSDSGTLGTVLRKEDPSRGDGDTEGGVGVDTEEFVTGKIYGVLSGLVGGTNNIESSDNDTPTGVKHKKKDSAGDQHGRYYIVQPKKTSIGARLHLQHQQDEALRLMQSARAKGKTGGDGDGDGDGGEKKSDEEGTSLSAKLTAEATKEVFQSLLFIDFIREMLTIDPHRRSTASQLLQHEFLADADTVDVFWDAHAANEQIQQHASNHPVLARDDDDDDDDDEHVEEDGDDIEMYESEVVVMGE